MFVPGRRGVAEVGFWRRSTSTIEQRSKSAAPVSNPPPLPRSISRAPSASAPSALQRSRIIPPARRVVRRESEALRFAQHLERLGPHVTPE
jgi:hypothetical protein